MSDIYKKTTTTSYGGRLKNSLVAVLIGIALFVGSFFVLFWNEGRVDLSKIAKTAVPIESSVVSDNPELQKELVVTQGLVTSPEQLGDSMFFKKGDYLVVERVSEMYSWVEKETSTKKKNMGGSETKETTYEYTKEWIEDVPDSERFYQSQSYYNPVKEIDSQTMTVSKAGLGQYQLVPSQVDFPETNQISVSAMNIDLPSDMTFIGDDYLYRGSDYNNLEVGDLRVSYQVVMADQEMTVFGALNGQNISVYTNDNGDSLYRLFYQDAEGAVALMHQEYARSVWLLRLIGFLMMWVGMLAMLRPITVFLDVVPIMGSISAFSFLILTLPVALVLSLLTIVLSILFHNIVVVMIAGIVALVIAFWFMTKRNKKAAPSAV